MANDAQAKAPRPSETEAASAVDRVLERGDVRTPDLGGTSSTDEVAAAIEGSLRG